MTEFEKGYEQGYKDGMASAALPNVNDNGDKIDGYSYAYKTDSNGEPYIHIDSVRDMLKKTADVQSIKYGKAVKIFDNPYTGKMFTTCSCCDAKINLKDNFCRCCGADLRGETNDKP